MNTANTNAAGAAPTIEVANEAQAESAVSDPASAKVRILSGLQAGRIVNYVMQNGAIRPLVVTDAKDATGRINGVLIFDGPYDQNNHPAPPLAESSGHLPSCVTHLVSVPYDELGLAPGFWHWPAKQPVVAAGIDAGALNVLSDAQFAKFSDDVIKEMHRALAVLRDDMKDDLMALVNEKVGATFEACNKLVEAHNLEMHTMDTSDETVSSIPIDQLPHGSVPKLESLKADPDVKVGQAASNKQPGS